VKPVFAALALLLLAATSGCRDQCVPVCEKNAKALGCGRADMCKEQCTSLHTSKLCLAEMKVFEKCFLKEPTDHWMCDEESIPALQLTYCQADRAKVVECLQKAQVPPAAPGAAAPPAKP
jgi:hypothetical protein